MDHFCKLFNLGDHQVLVIMSNDSDENQFLIELISEVFGIRASVKLKWSDEPKRDDHFQKFDEVQARLFLQRLMTYTQ